MPPSRSRIILRDAPFSMLGPEIYIPKIAGVVEGSSVPHSVVDFAPASSITSQSWVHKLKDSRSFLYDLSFTRSPVNIVLNKPIVSWGCSTDRTESNDKDSLSFSSILSARSPIVAHGASG